MGLFSSKKKYYAYAGTSALFDDGDRPDTLKSKILESTLTADGPTKAGAVMTTIFTDQFARAKSQMRYAERFEDPDREGGYIRGFPTSNMTFVSVVDGKVLEALERAVGPVDGIKWVKSGVADEVFMISKAIQDRWYNTDFFPWDETLGAPENLWDEDDETIPIPVINPDTEDYYQVDNLPDYTQYLSFLPDPENEDLYDAIGPDWFAQIGNEYLGHYTIRFHYEDFEENPQTWEMGTVDLTNYLAGLWIQVKYEQGGETKYWAYEVDSGVDPILEDEIDVQQNLARYLPVAVLMQDKKWFNEDPDSELATTTNKLIKKLATSGDEIREDFEEAEEENKEEGGDKWDFFVHYAVPLDSNVRGSKEYLYYFFHKYLRDWSDRTEKHYYDYLDAGGGSDQPVNELNITEAGVNGYNVAYRWSFIETRDFAGDFIIEDLSQAEATERPLEPSEVFTQKVEREETDTAEYQQIMDDFWGEVRPIGDWGDDKDEAGYHDFFIITRAKPRDPENPEVQTGYTQTVVMGLSMEYKINTSEDGDYRFRYAQPRMFGTDEETKEFRIPLQWGALKDVKTLHREEACADGLCATVFLVQVVKVKWYQTGFFKWLLIIIAVILIVISIWFPALIKGAIAAFGAAMGGGGLAMFVAYVVIQFAIGFMIALGTSLMSPDMQMWLAVVILVAMMFTGGFAAIGDSWGQLIKSPGFGSAQAFLNAVMPIYNMGFRVYSTHVMDELESEMRDFEKTAREKQMELEDAMDGFGPVPSWLDPMDLVKMFKRQGSTEKADSYYNRTLNANPGVEGFALISQFPEAALALPKDGEQQTIIDGMMADFAKQRGAA